MCSQSTSAPGGDGSSLVLLRGYPAVGKTTIGRRLRDVLGNCVCISIDSVIDMLGEPDDGRNRRLGYMASLHLAALFMKLGMQVIMEGLFIDTKNIDRAFELGAEMGYRVFMFELTATIADIAERNSHAGRKPVGDLDGLLAFLGDRYGADTRAVQIDTSSMSIDMALGKIMDVLGVLS